MPKRFLRFAPKIYVSTNEWRSFQNRKPWRRSVQCVEYRNYKNIHIRPRLWRISQVCGCTGVGSDLFYIKQRISFLRSIKLALGGGWRVLRAKRGGGRANWRGRKALPGHPDLPLAGRGSYFFAPLPLNSWYLGRSVLVNFALCSGR